MPSLAHCICQDASQILTINFCSCVGSIKKFHSPNFTRPRHSKINTIEDIRLKQYKHKIDRERKWFGSYNQRVHTLVTFKKQINIFNVRVIIKIRRFYGSKGEKVRSIDLSSRIRRFVYDSKTTIAVVINLLSNIDQR